MDLTNFSNIPVYVFFLKTYTFLHLKYYYCVLLMDSLSLECCSFCDDPGAMVYS